MKPLAILLSPQAGKSLVIPLRGEGMEKSVGSMYLPLDWEGIEKPVPSPLIVSDPRTANCSAYHTPKRRLARERQRKYRELHIIPRFNAVLKVLEPDDIRMGGKELNGHFRTNFSTIYPPAQFFVRLERLTIWRLCPPLCGFFCACCKRCCWAYRVQYARAVWLRWSGVSVRGVA